MHKRTVLFSVFFIAAAALMIFVSCQSVPNPEDIPQDLSPAEFFQQAQEEADNFNWDAALVYYQTFKDRYPQELARNIAADYEIAFIYYKKENLEKSYDLFSEIIESYEKADEGIYPERFRILSEKLLAIIDEQLNPPTEEE
jgi:outer membrane protein assembly factor BamD (BamD/ComL family)